MVLAAGEGTRLRPLTDTCPKPLVPLAGRPLLEHTLCHLCSQGITDVAINLHHRAEAIMGHLGDGRRLGVSLTYSVEETILGTAGALSKLDHYFTETFLLLYGDMLTDVAVAPLVEFHRSKGALATIGVFHVEDPSACGILDMEEDGKVRRFLEKPRPDQVFSRWANTGIYVLEPRIIEYIPRSTFYDFAFNLFPELLSMGQPLYGCPVQGYVRDIGTWENYRQAEKDLAAGRLRLSAGLSQPGLERA